MESYYDILGIRAEASAENIRKAYRKKAKQHHPDRNLSTQVESAEKFKKIQEAYAVLSDPYRRLEYNVELIDAPSVIPLFVFVPNPQRPIFHNFGVGVTKGISGITVGVSAVLLSGVAAVSGVAWSLALSDHVSTGLIMTVLPVALSIQHVMPISLPSILFLTLSGASFLRQKIQDTHVQLTVSCFHFGISSLCDGLRSTTRSMSYLIPELSRYLFTTKITNNEPLSAKVEDDWVLL